MGVNRAAVLAKVFVELLVISYFIVEELDCMIKVC
jgi:hypothetical protein